MIHNLKDRIMERGGGREESSICSSQGWFRLKPVARNLIPICFMGVGSRLKLLGLSSATS